jgi:hypothetical protein
VEKADRLWLGANIFLYFLNGGSMHRPKSRLLGAFFVCFSAIGFGAMAIFGKIAFASGVSTATLLFIRFLLPAP